MLKTESDNPTIGLLICSTKNNTVVEYALEDISKPIGVSEYKITKKLPEQFKSSLPSIEEIEAELNLIDDGENKMNNNFRFTNVPVGAESISVPQCRFHICPQMFNDRISRCNL